MNKILKARGFDAAGVRASENGPVIAFVVTETLKGGTVGEHASAMSAEHLISDATPLGDLLTVLHAKERVFVLVGLEVKGIVTRADLNKPPVRVYLFGLLSLLEMHMRFWVRASYPQDSWQEKLKEERVGAAAKLQAYRRGRNEEITLLDCLQFCDLRELVVARDDLREMLGLDSKKKANGLLHDAEQVRNGLARSQVDLVQGSSWQDVIEVVEKVETLVHRSDDAVEQEARSARKSVDALWVAG
jgi:hypothetical protein